MSTQSVTRIEGLRNHGVPTLHVEPVPARLRQLRVVIQELEQDDVQVVTPRSERTFGQKKKDD